MLFEVSAVVNLGALQEILAILEHLMGSSPPATSRLPVLGQPPMPPPATPLRATELGAFRYGSRLEKRIAFGIPVPRCAPFVAPILYAIPVQLLAYHVAVLKGTDVDQPRNLAKSVTVE